MKKKKKKFKYTKEHLEFLRIEYRSMTVFDLAMAFSAHFGIQKSESEIKAALSNHKIKCGRAHKDRLVNRLRLFTPEQVEFLKIHYKGRSVAELRDVFNIRFDTGMTRSQIRTAVHNRGITSGRTGQFPKGHAPWNKGTKGMGLTGANKKSFKKGNVPANRKPLGSERIDKDGYVYIKVKETDPHTGFPTRYKPKHRHIWEQVNGPVPDGMCLIFKNGNTQDLRPENMELVSRAELLRMNQVGYKDAPDDVKPAVLLLAKLKTKTFELMRKDGGDESETNRVGRRGMDRDATGVGAGNPGGGGSL